MKISQKSAKYEIFLPKTLNIDPFFDDVRNVLWHWKGYRFYQEQLQEMSPPTEGKVGRELGVKDKEFYKPILNNLPTR